MKLLTILGARPQFIKAGAVSRVIGQESGINEKIVHTGQHYDQNMSDIFFSQMEIPEPDYRLELGSLSHGAMTGRMLERLESIMIIEKPNVVMVYGDTNTTLAGALAASKLHIPVAHVEAGLRSFNMKMPEEVNRVLTDRVSAFLFCPTKAAVDNLKSEGFGTVGGQIFLTGDVMQDAAMHYAEKSCGDDLPRLARGEEYVLCTLHRAENTDNRQRLSAIVDAINQISIKENVVVPLHPRTQDKLAECDIKLNALVVDPVGYLEMIALLKQCRCVMTDSGGLQKESYFFGKPCITLRDETEWVELISSGCNVLVGANKEKILAAYKYFSSVTVDVDTNLYGGGSAANNIVDILASTA